MQHQLETIFCSKMCIQELGFDFVHIKSHPAYDFWECIQFETDVQHF